MFAFSQSSASFENKKKKRVYRGWKESLFYQKFIFKTFYYLSHVFNHLNILPLEKLLSSR